MLDPKISDLPAGVEDGFSSPDEPILDRRADSKSLRPELRLADRLAHEQPLPVPIDRMLEALADVILVDLPSDLSEVDAVSISYSRGRRSRVLINRSKSTRLRRERFTKAHELGHLVIPWHVGAIGCTTYPGASGGDPWTAQREAEANRFAARLLVPQAWLVNHVIPNEPGNIFQTLDEAAVSALPALLRLVPELPFGWMLVLSGEDAKVWRSPGSFMPPVDPEAAGRAERISDRNGWSELGGRSVRWWVWEPVAPPYPNLPVLTGRNRRPLVEVRQDQLREAATESLRIALRESGRSDDDVPHFAGVTGAIHKNATVRTPAGMFSALRQRFSDREAEGEIVANQNFSDYLAAKAWQFSDAALQY